MTFADRIMSHKYAHTKTDGTKETWDEIAKRVARSVMKAVNSPKSLTKEVERVIREKKFVPGGRYLYAAGRPYHQTQNCFDGSTAFITRKGISTLEQSCGKTVEVLNKNGAWESAEVRAFDEQEIIKLRLSNGVEINTTEGHLWIQPDGSRVSTVEAEQVMLSPGNTEVALDSDGIRHGVIFGDGHMVNNRYSQIVLCGEKKQELADLFLNETREIVVGFGAVIKVQTVRDSKRGKVVSLQPRHYKELPVDPTPSYARGFIAGLVATDGCVPSGGSITISCEGLELANSIGQIAVLGGCVVNSVRVTSKISPFDGTPRELSVVSLKPFSVPIIRTDQKQTLSRRKLRRCLSATVDVEAIEYTGRYEPVYCVVAPQTQTFTLACGVLTSNCLLLRAEDSREGWAELMHKSCKALMTGAGIGIDYSEIRAKGKAIRKTGGQATGPCALMEMVNCAGRGIMQGGSRRSAIWAGLNWKHPDIHEFITSKNWIPEVRALKLKDFNFPATMDGTNISVQLDDEFFKAYGDEAHHQHALAYGVYWQTVRQMARTGEPGFSIDLGANYAETLRNACCEVSSADDSDICNLGSINLARIKDIADFNQVLELGTAFLLAGTVYSDVPYPQVDQVRTKNRRLGLGLMGIHEWLLKRGKKYGPDLELEKYLYEYTKSTNVAKTYADKWDLSAPVKTRAIAPTGTISIISGTTSGIEPLFCAAYKRRYLKGSTWQFEYVIDPIAKQLVDSGMDPEQIEDAYSIGPERRVDMQAWLQNYVDHAISSTCNIPAWGTESNNESTVQQFGAMLIKYLPKLRGLTVYPDASRGGQPLSVVKYATAVKHSGEVFEESGDVCEFTKGGSCGA